MSTLQPHFCEVIPQKYIWIGILLAMFGGEIPGRSLPYLMGLVMFPVNNHKNMWRYYILVLSIPALLFILLALFFLDESPKFLLSRGDQNNARKVLNKMAKKNQKRIEIPESVMLELDLDNELSINTVEETGFWKSVREALLNFFIVRNLICVVMIGFLVHFTMNDLGYIATELVFLWGQTDKNYCQGSRKNSYLLQPSDYIMLTFYMSLTTVLKMAAVVPAKMVDVDFKESSTVCMLFSLCIASCLYACPKIWAALLIYALIDTTGIFLELNYTIYLSKILPTKVRSLLYGAALFLMYVPLSATPFLIQVLSKESVYYVTTVTISFIIVGLLGSLLLPSNRSQNN